MKGKLSGDAKAMRSLRAMGEGGWRTQADLHAFGKVHDDRCQTCLGAKGTFLHRCVGCPLRAKARRAYKNQTFITKAQSMLHSEEPLFAHGIPVARPRVPKLAPEICYFNGAEEKGVHRVWVLRWLPPQKRP